jgi:hypothetical protein
MAIDAVIDPCGPAVDGSGTNDAVTGTPVDGGRSAPISVDEHPGRPRSVLTPFPALTCDDARRPQFPQALLLRRVLLLKRPIFVEPGDDRHTRQAQQHRMRGRR